MAIIKSVHLEFVDPAVNADKMYDIEVHEEDGHFWTAIAYGRRGAAPQRGTKYEGPDRDAAIAAFAKAYAEKTGKGYVEA